jgi:hypothetical protein
VVFFYSNGKKKVEKSCSFTYFGMLMLGRQGGGLEEQFSDVLLQGLCDNGRPSEDMAEMNWLNAILCSLFKMAWKP